MNQAAAQQSAARSLLKDLVALTKPRIISLLLVTTIAPMFVAGRPSWTLVLAVFIGGYLMAGGANTVNMYLDRDIDERMARTKLRPIPAGRMHSRHVLFFGVMLVMALGLAFAAWASLGKEESNMRSLFSLLAVITLVIGVIFYLGVPTVI